MINRIALIILTIWICFILSACSSLKNSLIKTGVREGTPLFTNMIAQMRRGNDLIMAQEGIPSLLLMMEGLIAETPNNGPLLIVGSEANASFAMGFIEDENKKHASLLYLKGANYGKRSLLLNEKFAKAVKEGKNYQKAVKFLEKEDVPAMFWTASNWGEWLRLNLSDTQALFDQPKILALINRIIELDDSFFYGGAHLLMANYYASQPEMMGGGRKKAKKEFDKAFKINGGKFLMAKVWYAKYYATLVRDKKLYISTLKKVVNTSPDIEPDIRIINLIAQKKAALLLDKADTKSW